MPGAALKDIFEANGIRLAESVDMNRRAEEAVLARPSLIDRLIGYRKSTMIETR